MRTSRRPSDSPSPGGNDPVDKTRRNRTDAAIDAMSPPAMAGNTLMDGAAGQLGGGSSQMNYDLAGPDGDEDE